MTVSPRPEVPSIQELPASAAASSLDSGWRRVCQAAPAEAAGLPETANLHSTVLEA